MKSCDTCGIFLFALAVIISKQLSVSPIYGMCQTIMAEWSKVIDTVFKLVLVKDFSWSMHKSSYLLANSLCILCLVI